MPDPVTLVGERVHVRPVEGDTVSVRETMPLKPLWLVTVTVEAPADPARPVAAVGLAVTVKSCDVNETGAETLLGPFVPVTVTL